jgi:hypothetical protein
MCGITTTGMPSCAIHYSVRRRKRRKCRKRREATLSAAASGMVGANCGVRPGVRG